MRIDFSNRAASIDQTIPANFCKHKSIMNVFTLFTSQNASDYIKSLALNTILTSPNIKNFFHKKKAEKALIKGIHHLCAEQQDKDKVAEKCFGKVAEYGYPIGHFLIGELYIQNASSYSEQEKGIEYLTKAAEKNHLYACLSLAEIYKYKAQTEPTYQSQVIKYYEKAGELGSSTAYFKLGEFFQKRAGKNQLRNNATQDYEKAIKCYKKAGELGCSTAYFKLGEFFQDRAGKKPFQNAPLDHEKKVIKYYKKAGKLGSSSAYYKLAEFFQNKAKKDWNSKNTILSYNSQVVKYYEKASSLGCKKSALILGDSYLYGHITEKNLDKAIDFFGKAGNLCSDLEKEICSWKNSGLQPKEKYFKLAEIFIDGIQLGTEDSLKELYTREAISYYEKAGELGFSEAYLRLSPIYFYGIGIEVNRTKTIECLEKAVLLGSSTARFRLKTIYTQLAEEHLLKEELQQTISYYEKAGSYGSSEAYFLLGEMCLCGRILKDLSTMMQYYEKAAEKLHPKACKRLYEIYYHGIAGKIEPNLNLAKKYLLESRNFEDIPFIDED